ncbi:MAG: TadE family protein [Terracidiphilus sp.]
MKMLSDMYGKVLALTGGLNRAVPTEAASKGARVKARSIGGQLRACLHFGEKGNALVETAVTLPVFLLLITGTFSITMALFSYEQLGNATFVASQTIQDGRGYVGDPCATAATSVVTTLPTWAAANFTFTLTMTPTVGTPVTVGPLSQTAFSCPSDGSDLGYDEPAVLTVSYQYTWIPSYMLNLGTGTLTQSRAVMVE